MLMCPGRRSDPPIGIQSLQWKFYIIWTVFNASFVPIVYFFYPETANSTLEDMDRLFREDQSIVVSGIRLPLASAVFSPTKSTRRPRCAEIAASTLPRFVG